MDENKVYDWDDAIQKDESFTLLDEGDYSFRIDNVDRSWFNGSEKLPACNMAIVTFAVLAKNGAEASIKQRFQLCQKMEWKLSQLFRSVGLKKEGEEIRMDWGALPGLTGKCKVTQYTGKNGNTYNDIGTLYPYEENAKPEFKGW